MNSKITQSLVAGIAATVVMTIVMMVAPMMGMAKMNPPALVSGMIGMPIAVGWIMHFIIGIVFAASYVYFFQSMLPIGNTVLKGIVFGIIIAILAKIGMLSLIHISEPTRRTPISYAVFCLKKKK